MAKGFQTYLTPYIPGLLLLFLVVFQLFGVVDHENHFAYLCDVFSHISSISFHDLLHATGDGFRSWVT
jgi:hypothetical protein